VLKSLFISSQMSFRPILVYPAESATLKIKVK